MWADGARVKNAGGHSHPASNARGVEWLATSYSRFGRWVCISFRGHCLHCIADDSIRMNIKPKISAYLEVLGIGSDGVDKALVLTVQQHGVYSSDIKILQRLLISGGEGIQRACCENGIKLTSVDTILINQLDIKCVAGIPGMIMALSSVGNGILNVYGPPGIYNYLNGCSGFAKRKYPKLRACEVEAIDAKDIDLPDDEKHVIHVPTPKYQVTHEDQVDIVPIPLHKERTDKASHRCYFCVKDQELKVDKVGVVITQAITSIPKHTDLSKEGSSSDGSSSDDSSSESSNSDEEINFISWLRNYYKRYNPVRVNQVEAIALAYAGREEYLKSILHSKYESNNPHDPNAGHASKKRKCEAITEDIKPVLDVEAPTYIFPAPSDQSVEPTHLSSDPSSILCFQLRIRTSNSAKIIWLIECATFEQIKFLITEPAFTKICSTHSPSLIVHTSSNEVVHDLSYMKWMTEFPPSIEHLVLENEIIQGSATSVHHAISFISSAQHHFDLHAQIPQLFPFSAELKQAKQNIQSKPAMDIRWGGPLKKRDCRLGIPGLRYEIIPHIEAPGFNVVNLVTKFEKYQRNSSIPRLERLKMIPFNQESSSEEFVPQLTILGTGSAAPSKLRGSSSLYIQTSAQHHGILLDAGEGTCGQFWRCFGNESKRRIGKLECIWISHKHADHQCGLMPLLVEHHRLRDPSQEPLLLIAPRMVLTYVQLCVAQAHNLIKYTPVPCDVFMRMNPISQRNLLCTRHISSLVTVPVIHCHDSFGILLELCNGFRLVYSGDTRPCPGLIRIGRQVDLLVHEATFANDMLIDAKKKRHSTVGEAIKVGNQMQAKHILLTHFSQRYPRLPPFQDIWANDLCQNANVSLAFDLMTLPLHPTFLQHVPTLIRQLCAQENHQ